MSKIKIFVCCHKPDDVKCSDVYIPLHVGRAQSKFKEEMKDMIGDDTGDNISEKNPYYSEATGIYWIWKNVHDADYVGLCHYRRFFDIDFDKCDIDKLFNNTDVILARKRPVAHSRTWPLFMSISAEDYVIMRGVMKKLYPDYVPTLDEESQSYYTHLFNMVVCKKELYNEYAEWLFNICSECEKYWKPSGYGNAKRTFAYLSEFLTPIFFIHNKYRIKGLDVIFNGEKLQYPLWMKTKYTACQLFNFRFKKVKPIAIDLSIYRGLCEDGIDVENL